MKKLFIIKWRNRNTLWVTSVITCLSTFATESLAQLQVDKWKRVFPQNTYYIELKA